MKVGKSSILTSTQTFQSFFEYLRGGQRVDSVGDPEVLGNVSCVFEEFFVGDI